MEELKTKCEAMIADLEEVKESCYADGIKGKIADVRSGKMYEVISATQNGLSRIIDTIRAYYTEQ